MSCALAKATLEMETQTEFELARGGTRKQKACSMLATATLVMATVAALVAASGDVETGSQVLLGRGMGGGTDRHESGAAFGVVTYAADEKTLFIIFGIILVILVGVIFWMCRQQVWKACMLLVKWVGFRWFMPIFFPKALSFYDVKKHEEVKEIFALTIDDAPCSQPQDKSMVAKVQTLLDKYNAKATFFLCSDYVFDRPLGDETRTRAEEKYESLKGLVSAGHEVANHGAADKNYKKGPIEDFKNAFLDAEVICDALPQSNNHWFRAPRGAMNSEMQEFIESKGFTNVMTDCFANDPWITDPEFISDQMLDMVTAGSIAVIHMPENGFRDYNYRALELFLKGLPEKEEELTAVTLTELRRVAEKSSSEETKQP